jgi:uncharacterized protein (TIGR02284 family)
MATIGHLDPAAGGRQAGSIDFRGAGEATQRLVDHTVRADRAADRAQFAIWRAGPVQISASACIASDARVGTYEHRQRLSRLHNMEDDSMVDQKVITTLNNLLETTKDGESGFRTCSDAVTNPQLKTVFETAARRCDEGAAELEAKIRSLGGEPVQSGSMTGSLHRAWTNIKSSITGMDDHAVLAECERGEDVAKHAYEAALEQDLPTDVESIIRRQYQGVVQNHDHIRNLRNQVEHGH